MSRCRRTPLLSSTLLASFVSALLSISLAACSAGLGGPGPASGGPNDGAAAAGESRGPGSAGSAGSGASTEPSSPSQGQGPITDAASSTPQESASDAPGSGGFSTGAATVATAGQALAAVIAQHPVYEGYVLVVSTPTAPNGPTVGRIHAAQDHGALAEAIPEGFRVILVTGSGDCQAGCTELRYDVFTVSWSGGVAAACSVATLPFPDRDPCSGL